MKKILLLWLAVGALASCQKVDDDVNADADVDRAQKVQFVMKGLDVEYVGTRATLASESISDLWVWEGSTLLCHQVSTDEDFGAPTISLTIGAHDLTFVASKSEGQTWSEGVWSCTTVKDTYGAVMSYTVSKSSASKQVQLTRCNGKVMWTIEDALPQDVKNVTIGVTENCFGLDKDLNGVQGKAHSKTMDISSAKGETGVAVSFMVLPASHSEGSEVTATIKIENTSGTSLCEYSNDITVKANEICNIHGTFFSAGSKQQVSLSSDWTKTTEYDL